MTDKEILVQIKPIIAKRLEINQSAITPNASFTKDLGADSIDIMELFMDVERHFGLCIPDSTQSRIQTVGGVIRAVKKYTLQKETVPVKSSVIALLAISGYGKQR